MGKVTKVSHLLQPELELLFSEKNHIFFEMESRGFFQSNTKPLFKFVFFRSKQNLVSDDVDDETSNFQEENNE